MDLHATDPDTDDPAIATEPGRAGDEAASGARLALVTFVGGVLMGSADLVPGVSGGTVALVIGIYERLVANIRQGARAASLLVRGSFRDGVRAVRHVEWTFLAPLLAGILTAIVALAGLLRFLLEDRPVMMSAGFFGLIVGSVVVAWAELDEREGREMALIAVSAVATFLVLGLRTGRFEDPSPVIFFLGGGLAIIAMILPGVSGSFILLMIGLYEALLTAVDERQLVTLAAVALGAVVGLGAFSTLLNWLLDRYRDIVVAVLIGLMLGSLRVLWPWPVGDGVGDTALGTPVVSEIVPAILLAVVGAAFVVGVARLAHRYSPGTTHEVLPTGPDVT